MCSYLCYPIQAVALALAGSLLWRLGRQALQLTIEPGNFLLQRSDLALVFAPLQHLRSVLMWRYSLEMFWVYALPHSTLVVDLHASLNEPEVNGIRDAMGLARYWMPRK